ncbi:MAG: ATP-dependent DNA helicase RecG [Christensenellaceae bacterium]|jgi:ATP-dependent DNA helicase RecG
MKYTDSVAKIKGVGKKTVALLEKLGIATVYDLLCHEPTYYRDLRQAEQIFSLQEGAWSVVKGTITMPPRWIQRYGKRSLFTFEVSDGSGVMDINIFNLPFLFSKYEVGDTYVFYGKTKKYKNRLQIDNPDVYTGDDLPGIIPYYALTAGITHRNLRSYINVALSETQEPSLFTAEFKESYSIEEDQVDFMKLHAPREHIETNEAHTSLALKELMVFQKKMQLLGTESIQRVPLQIQEDAVARFTEKLPFTCTAAQMKAMEDAYHDLLQKKPANRLIQGDVGSGKTVVALFIAYATALAGGQTVIMAPTELLAEQHAAFARNVLEEGSVALLTGTTPAKRREEILAGIAAGEIKTLIGTHAVLYAPISWHALEALIIDEQQRFGVEQRAYFSEHYKEIHLFVMSATPIPRSLAIVLYGNADISIINEMPPGRIPTSTFLVQKTKRSDMYDWIYEKTKAGEKAYVVCPLLEPSEGINALSAIELQEALVKRYPTLQTGLLHGKMPGKEKQRIMEAFRIGEIALLVSTTVVEVGVDVPDANIMVVENADRFGLSQLHQLRGRVGRGGAASFCYFVTDGSGLTRLQVLKESNDGFYIAEKDLALRGAGEFFGTQQHGAENFRFVDIMQDSHLIYAAKKAIEEINKFPKDEAVINSLALQSLEHSLHTAL